MKTTTQKKKDDMTLTITVNPARIAKGPLPMALRRGGVHKDKRRQSKNNARISFKKGME